MAGMKQVKIRDVLEGGAVDVGADKRSVLTGSKITIIEKGNSLEIESVDSRMFERIVSIIANRFRCCM